MPRGTLSHQHGAMSTPDPTNPAPPAPSATDGFFDSIRRTGLLRGNDRWIAGVGSGLSRRLGIDPLVVRGLLLASVLLGGLGIVLYAIAWMLLPEENDGRIHLQELFRGHADIAVLGAAVLLVTGLTMTGSLVPGWYFGGRGDSGWWQGLVWLGLVVTVVALLVSRRGRRGTPNGYGPTTTLRPAELRTPGPAAPPSSAFAAGPTTPIDDPTSAGHGSQSEGPSMSTTPMTPVPPTPGATPALGYGYQPSVSQPVTPSGYGPAWQGQQGGPTAVLTPQQPRAPRGAGRGTLGVVVALTLIVLAGLLYADRLGRLAAPVGLLTIAAAVIFLGAAIAVAGIRGRSAGGLGALAIVLMLIGAPIAATEKYDLPTPTPGQGAIVGEVDRRPITTAEAEAGYDLGAGSIRVDLTALPASAGTVTVPVRITAGEVIIVVPQGTAVTADISLNAGEIVWFGDRTERRPSDPKQSTFAQQASDAPTGPSIMLDITMGVGSLTVEESGR